MTEPQARQQAIAYLDKLRLPEYGVGKEVISAAITLLATQFLMAYHEGGVAACDQALERFRKTA